MKKKFFAFFGATVLLFAMLFGIWFKYLRNDSHMVFIESFDHGVVTVDGGITKGSDKKYRVECEPGQEITLNINPERNDSAYYNLKSLYVNGVNVTKEVDMLQYRTKVTGKLTVVASFKKGKRPEGEAVNKEISGVSRPKVERPTNNTYFGSYASYDIEDPSIIYDEKSGYFYCFGSDNVVIKSQDLVNWTGRTTYFQSPDKAQSNSVMSFSTFPSVKKWAKAHGYSSDETYSGVDEDRTPLSPDIVKIGGTYYLYFALSKSEGANESAIFCVKTNDLESAVRDKNWDDAGLVISSCGRHSGSTVSDEGERESFKAHYDEANAVHPSVITTDNGVFMVYGGYYGKEKIGGEIYLVELSSKNGLLKNDSKFTKKGDVISTLHGEKRFNAGTVIAAPGKIPSLSKNDGSLISGADIIYNSKTGYYYLFVTYGTAATNYEIRVARSKNIEGPYTDYNGNEMQKFGKSAKNNQYTKGNQLMAGYGFIQSSEGAVSYSDIGKASIGSPSLIYTKNGSWFLSCQAQGYFIADGSISTGYANAEAAGALVEAYPSLDMREIRFTEDGWPVAMSQMYSGEKAVTKLKTSNLYGNWDVIIFDKNSVTDDHTAVVRNTSQTVSILKNATVTQNDIAKKKDLNTEKLLRKSGDGFIVTIDSVEYMVYPAILWDWELGEGSLTFSGIGADGSTIWGKKNTSGALGIYTDTFYYVLDMCDDATKEIYEKKIDKISSNPSQSQIDSMTNSIVAKLIETQK